MTLTILTIILIALNVLDYITTIKGINSGKASENNPGAAWLFSHLPQSLWWLPKGVVFGALILLAWKVGGIAGPLTLGLSCAVLGYIVYNNYKIISS